MLFEELDIKPFYDSKKTDVYNDFFNIVLSNSKYYRRFGGIFSTKRFILIAEGLQDFIQKNFGVMELVIISNFSQSDKEALLKGISADDLITKNWIDSLSKIKEKILEDHIKAISWMIANDYLKIKIIIPEHDDGTPLLESELNKLAIFRREIGLFYHKDNDSRLSFHGIIDRDNSEMGELYSLDVSRKWIVTEENKLEQDHNDFTNYWNNEKCQIGSITCKIIPLSKKLESYFKKIAPLTKAEIPTLKKLPILRRYQSEAIDSWMAHDGNGIFEMATGTGKTFTAIGCIQKIQNKENKALIIIAAPSRSLIDQWHRELSKWFIDAVILESGIWRITLRDEIHYLNTTSEKTISVLITSHDLFSDKEFVRQIENCKIPAMLLVDEAHHVGTLNTRNGLSTNYSYRLALSATITRYFDDDGTSFLHEYFKNPPGKPTFEYSLEKAIRSKRLCSYNYYPFFIDLTDEELIDYKQYTYKAARLLNSKDPQDRKKGEHIIMKRAKIIRDAQNKSECLIHILKQIPQLKHLLIFCSENQFGYIEKILKNMTKHRKIDKSLSFRKITYANPKKKKDRIKILDDFANEDLDILLSNKILDEGMDVPQAKNCIILASTGNPTQFIQRRGRVLRTYADLYKDGSKKTHADIYDILVKPQISNLDDPDSIKLELGMIRSQLAKIQQMGNLALNHEYCAEKIKEFTYGRTF